MMNGSTNDIHTRLDAIESKLEKITFMLSNIDLTAQPQKTLTNMVMQGEITAEEIERVHQDTVQWQKRFIKSIANKRHYKHATEYCPYPHPFPDSLTPEKYFPHQVLNNISGFQYYRAWLYHFMHNESLNLWAERLEFFIFFLIILSSISYILSTVEDFESVIWEVIEVCVSIIFTVEYLARVSSVRNLHWYVIQPLNMIDLIAVLPWYVEKSTGAQGTGLRVLRVVRLARVFRMRSMMEEYSEIISRAVVRTIAQSSGMVSLIILLELSVCSSLMYVIEKDHGSGFTSIPMSMYWCMVTITTVGYGDMYPVTDLGRFLACITMFSGLIVIACVVIMFGGNFEESQKSFFERKRRFEDNRVDPDVGVTLVHSNPKALNNGGIIGDACE